MVNTLSARNATAYALPPTRQATREADDRRRRCRRGRRAGTVVKTTAGTTRIAVSPAATSAFDRTIRQRAIGLTMR